MAADNVVTGSRLVAGMTVRRMGLKEWFTVARVQRDGRTINIHWHHTTEPTTTNPRDRWEVHEGGAGQPENQPENMPGNIPADSSRPDPKACPACGRGVHKCNTCGNEYGIGFHDAWQLHLEKAHSRTDGPATCGAQLPDVQIGNQVKQTATCYLKAGHDGPKHRGHVLDSDDNLITYDWAEKPRSAIEDAYREVISCPPGELGADDKAAIDQFRQVLDTIPPRSATDVAREKLGLAEGEPAPEVRATVAQAMSRLHATKGTAGDPEAARQAVDAVMAAVNGEQPAEPPMESPVEAAAGIIEKVRAERSKAKADGEYVLSAADTRAIGAPLLSALNPGAGFLEVHLFQPGAAIVIAETGQDHTHLLPDPPKPQPPQLFHYREQLASAEDVFDQVAGWQLAPEGRWQLTSYVGDDQSVTVLARRPITRVGAR